MGGRGDTVGGREEMMSSVLEHQVEEPVGCPGGDVHRQLRKEI